MKLIKGQWASADGPYIRATGEEVKALVYKELVEVLVPNQGNGEVYVVGIDSQQKTWILESSLTPITLSKPVEPAQAQQLFRPYKHEKHPSGYVTPPDPVINTPNMEPYPVPPKQPMQVPTQVPQPLPYNVPPTPSVWGDPAGFVDKGLELTLSTHRQQLRIVVLAALNGVDITTPVTCEWLVEQVDAAGVRAVVTTNPFSNPLNISSGAKAYTVRAKITADLSGVHYDSYTPRLTVEPQTDYWFEYNHGTRRALVDSATATGVPVFDLDGVQTPFNGTNPYRLHVTGTPGDHTGFVDIPGIGVTQTFPVEL